MENHNFSWSSNNTSDDYIPVPELAKGLKLYTISQFVLNYSAVPISVWGWIGNLLSFK